MGREIDEHDRSRLLTSSCFSYDGDSVDELREAIASVFSPIHLEPDRNERLSRAHFEMSPLRKSSISYHHIGAKCVDGPLAPIDYHTLGTALSGTHSYTVGKAEVQGTIDQWTMLSGKFVPRIHHSSDNGILAWTIKDEVVRDHLSAWLGYASSPAIRFEPVLDKTNARTASFLETFRSFIRQLNRDESVLQHPAALASFENALVTAMLVGLDHNLRDLLQRPQPDAGSAVVRRVEEYLEAHASDPLDMPTLARATGYSTRSIHRAFSQYRDYSPIAFLTDVRLRLARRMLVETQEGTQVTRIAYRSGFSHLGRFARAYKQRFGESPRETLKRAGVWRDPAK